MNLKETFAKIKVLLSGIEPEVIEVILEKQTLMDDVTVLEAEAFEVDQPVFIVTETENVALPVGNYELKDGRVLVVDVEGIIASIGEPMEEEAPSEEAPEEQLSELVISQEDYDSAIAGLQSQIDELKASLNLSSVTIAEKDTEIAELNVKLAALPATTKLSRVNEIAETISNKKQNNKPATKFATILNHINK